MFWAFLGLSEANIPCLWLLYHNILSLFFCNTVSGMLFNPFGPKYLICHTAIQRELNPIPSFMPLKLLFSNSLWFLSLSCCFNYAFHGSVKFISVDVCFLGYNTDLTGKCCFLLKFFVEISDFLFHHLLLQTKPFVIISLSHIIHIFSYLKSLPVILTLSQISIESSQNQQQWTRLEPGKMAAAWWCFANRLLKWS